MNYSQIISRSFEIVKKFRFLFWLGLLAGITQGGSSNIDTSYFKSNDSSPASSNNANEFIAHVEKIWQSVLHWAQSNVPIIILALIVMIIIGLVFMYISYAARAGLVLSVAKIESNDMSDLNFQSTISKGKEFFWRLVGLQLFTSILIALPIMVLVFSALAAVGFNSEKTGWLVGVFGILILLIIPFIIYVFIISSMALFAERIIIIKNLSITQSMKNAWHIVKSKWTNILVLYLIQSGLMIAVGICLSIIYAIFLGPFIYTWRGDYSKIIAGNFDSTIATHIGVVLAVSFIISIIARAWINVFISAYWTISYRALDYLSKPSLPNTNQEIK